MLLGADAAPLPLTLPWYMVAVMVGVWCGAVCGIVIIAARLLRARSERRRRRRVPSGAGLEVFEE